MSGQDSNGNPLPAGTYTYAVSATDISGKSIAATTYQTGTVTGVNSSSGTTVLQLGTTGSVPVSQVVQVTS